MTCFLYYAEGTDVTFISQRYLTLLISMFCNNFLHPKVFVHSSTSLVVILDNNHNSWLFGVRPIGDHIWDLQPPKWSWIGNFKLKRVQLINSMSAI